MPAIHRDIPAPKALDADFKARKGDDALCLVVNLTNNRIEVPIGPKGEYVILGASVDKGIIGTPQPEHATTVGAVRRAKMNPAFNMLFDGPRPALDTRGQAIIFDTSADNDDSAVS